MLRLSLLLGSTIAFDNGAPDTPPLNGRLLRGRSLLDNQTEPEGSGTVSVPLDPEIVEPEIVEPQPRVSNGKALLRPFTRNDTEQFCTGFINFVKRFFDERRGPSDVVNCEEVVNNYHVPFFLEEDRQTLKQWITKPWILIILVLFGVYFFSPLLICMPCFCIPCCCMCCGCCGRRKGRANSATYRRHSHDSLDDSLNS